MKSTEPMFDNIASVYLLLTHRSLIKTVALHMREEEDEKEKERERIHVI